MDLVDDDGEALRVDQRRSRRTLALAEVSPRRRGKADPVERRSGRRVGTCAAQRGPVPVGGRRERELVVEAEGLDHRSCAVDQRQPLAVVVESPVVFSVDERLVDGMRGDERLCITSDDEDTSRRQYGRAVEGVAHSADERPAEEVDRSRSAVGELHELEVLAIERVVRDLRNKNPCVRGRTGHEQEDRRDERESVDDHGAHAHSQPSSRAQRVPAIGGGPLW